MIVFLGGIFTVIVFYGFINIIGRMAGTLDKQGKDIEKNETSRLVVELNKFTANSYIIPKQELLNSELKYDLKINPLIISYLKANTYQPTDLFKSLNLMIRAYDESYLNELINAFNKRIDNTKIDKKNLSSLRKDLQDSDLIIRNLTEKYEKIYRHSEVNTLNSNEDIFFDLQVLYTFRVFIGVPFEFGHENYVDKTIKLSLGKKINKFKSIDYHLKDFKKSEEYKTNIHYKDLINRLDSLSYQGELNYYRFAKDLHTISIAYEYGLNCAEALNFVENKLFIQNGIFNTPYLINLVYRYKQIANHIDTVKEFKSEYRQFVHDCNQILVIK